MKNLNRIRPPEVFEAIARESKARAFDMPSEVDVNALLRTLAAVKPAGRCLELGTGTGLASAWLLDGLGPQGRLTTVDSEPNWLEVARNHLGKDPRVEIVCADGDEFLRQASEKSTRYDLIFADTWSGKYRLLDLALNLMAPSRHVCDQRHAAPAQLARRARSQGSIVDGRVGSTATSAYLFAAVVMWCRDRNKALIRPPTSCHQMAEPFHTLLDQHETRSLGQPDHSGNHFRLFVHFHQGFGACTGSHWYRRLTPSSCWIFLGRLCGAGAL